MTKARRRRWFIFLVCLLAGPFFVIEVVNQALMARRAHVPDRQAVLLDDRAALVFLAGANLPLEALEAPEPSVLSEFLWSTVSERRGRCGIYCRAARGFVSRERPAGSIESLLRYLGTHEWMRRHFTPHEAMTLWAENAWFGGSRYGLRDAARELFNREVEALSVAQLAWLAVLSESPSRYAKNTEQLLHRRNELLGRLHEAGLLDGAQFLRATGEITE